MTLNELNDHLDLIDKLKNAQELLDSFWSKANPKPQALTGMPHGTGVSDKVGDLAAEIADMEDRVEYLKGKVKESEAPILAFIREIDDDKTRMIFRFRYIRGFQWKEVADMVGNWATEASVKSICYRYIDCSCCEEW